MQQRQQQRQQQQRSYNRTPHSSTKSGWQRYDAFIRSIGEWFEEHTDLLSTIINGLIFVAYVIAVIATWISEGFWEALLTGVIGFFITGLAIWGTTIVTNIVSWILSNIVFRNGWLFLIVLALFIISGVGVVIFKHYFLAVVPLLLELLFLLNVDGIGVAMLIEEHAAVDSVN